MTPEERIELEARFVAKESRNPRIVAIYTDLYTPPSGIPVLCYDIVVDPPAVGTVASRIAACEARQAKLIYQKT